MPCPPPRLRWADMGAGGGKGRGEVMSAEDQAGRYLALTSLSYSTGEEVAGGDRLIHERDLAWLQQADGEHFPLLPTNSC